MLNIFLLLIIAQLLTNLINPSKTSYSVLQCGIWGYHGTDKKKLFQWAKFDILGTYNDERGGDACGRYAGNHIEHDNSTSGRKYRDYIKKFYPPKLNRQTGTIIGHARKSSYFHGANNGLHLTQPIARWNEADSIITDVLVHNGTIYNTDELMDQFNAPDSFSYRRKTDDGKFWFDKQETNDSNIIGDILFNNENYDEILRAYRGTASLVWYNREEDKMFMFAGESRNNKNSVSVYERPLWMLKGDDHVWFSSLEDPLAWIKHRDEDEVEEVPKNTLLTFQSGVLIDELFIDRSESSQSTHYKPNETVTTSNASRVETFPVNLKALNSGGEKPKVGETISLTIAGIPTKTYVIYDGDDQCTLCKGTGENIYVQDVKCRTCHGTGQNQKSISTNLTVGYQRKFQKKEEDKYPKVVTSNILSEDIPDYDSLVLKFARLRYWDFQELAHGIYNLTPLGEKRAIKTEEGGVYETTKVYYFVKGVMLKDHTAFQTWSRRINKNEKDIPQELIEDIVLDSEHPITQLNNEFVLTKNEGETDWKLATMSVNPLFSRKIYKLSSAICENIITCPYGINIPVHKTKSDIEEEEELSNNNVTLPELNHESDEQEIFEASLVGHINESEDNDGPYDQLVKTEISSDIAHVMNSLTEARDSVSMYSDHRFGLRAHDIMDELYSKIRDFGEELNSGLPF